MGHNVSYLFYVDDALFLSDQDKGNIENLITIVSCFSLTYELCINLQKLNLYGIGIDFHHVEDIAVGTKCSAAFIPFSYLGIPLGLNMGRVNSWNLVVQKFKKCLAN